MWFSLCCDQAACQLPGSLSLGFMLVPRETGVCFCPVLSPCVPEHSRGTGHTFGFGEEIQVPNTPPHLPLQPHWPPFWPGTSVFAQCPQSSSPPVPPPPPCGPRVPSEAPLPDPVRSPAICSEVPLLEGSANRAGHMVGARMTKGLGETPALCLVFIMCSLTKIPAGAPASPALPGNAAEAGGVLVPDVPGSSRAQ